MFKIFNGMNLQTPTALVTVYTSVLVSCYPFNSLFRKNRAGATQTQATQ